MQDSRQLIIESLKQRAIPKQDVFSNTLSVFSRFKQHVETMSNEISAIAAKLDKRLDIRLLYTGEFEVQFKVAGDVLVFSMHSNVFNFDDSHEIHQTDYVKADPTRSYCGLISIHNFLADTYKYNRLGDRGLMIARIMVNKENHFFVEGQRQLGFLYNDFANAELNEVYIRAIIESAILYSFEFELITPPYEASKEITLQEMKLMSAQAGLKTTKHPGYKFSYEQEPPKM